MYLCIKLFTLNEPYLTVYETSSLPAFPAALWCLCVCVCVNVCVSVGLCCTRAMSHDKYENHCAQGKVSYRAHE